MKSVNVNLNPIFNANGDISDFGYQYLVDTLTAIKKDVVNQKFYEVAPGDYMPVDVGSDRWSDEIVQNLSFQTGGDFFSGDVDTAEGNGNIASVDAALSPIRMPVNTWAKAINYTVMELKKAMRSNNWDLIAAKLEALKKNWDLGIQSVGFLGHPGISLMTGLLNDSEVNSNLTVITKDISAMTDSEFQTFVAGVMGAYFDNSNSTALPDTFVIPTDDFLGLSSAASATYPNISKLEYLLNSFKKMTANEGFEIKPLAYSQTERNSLGVDRYVLYRNQPDTLTMNIPVDFTQLEAGNVNSLQFQQPAYGQYSGCLINRKREVLYFDK